MPSCIGSACNKVFRLQGTYCHHHSAGAQRRSDAVRDTSLHPSVSRRHPNSVEVGLRWFAPSRTLHGSFAECCTGHHPGPDTSDSKNRVVSSSRLNLQFFKIGEYIGPGVANITYTMSQSFYSKAGCQSTSRSHGIAANGLQPGGWS